VSDALPPAFPRLDYGESDIRAWMYDKERTRWPPHREFACARIEADLIRSLKTALFRLACTRRKLHYALLGVPVPLSHLDDEAQSLPTTITPSTSE